MTNYIQPHCATSKSLGELAHAFLMLAILSCEDKSEQKARILIAYEDGNFTPEQTERLIRILGLGAA